MRGLKPQLVVDNAAASINEPEPAPDWMGEEAKEEWLRILPDIIARGALTSLDRGTLENYCVVTGRIRQIEKLLREADPTQFLKISRMQNTLITNAKQLAAELGLTPMARSRKPLRGDSSEGGTTNGDLFADLDL